MAEQLEVEGDTATAAGHDLSELRQELSQHQVLYVVDICSAYDAAATLKDLITLRKEDILELIDEINGDANNQHRIQVMKKNQFAKIIANYAERQNNGEDDIDPTKHVTTDREEREAIGKLFHRIKNIGSAILSVSEAVKQVEVLRKECETEIVSMFAVQRESLKQREEQLLTELAQVAERKTVSLSEQVQELKQRLVSTDRVHKALNVRLKKAIYLHEIDGRKNEIVKQCQQEMSLAVRTAPCISVNIAFVADAQSMARMIASFGMISSLVVPSLLRLYNVGSNVISIDVEIERMSARTEKRTKERLKVEWMYKEEKEDDAWKEQIMALTASSKQTVCVTVDKVGTYDFRLRYNDGLQNAYSSPSPIQSISVRSVYPNLVVASNQCKVLQPDKVHYFTSIVIESRGVLRVSLPGLIRFSI